MTGNTTYQFFRNVRTYGAKGDGTNDDTEAINAAIQDGQRCDIKCGNSFATSALVYFPVTYIYTFKSLAWTFY
jgi:polygalacturonase